MDAAQATYERPLFLPDDVAEVAGGEVPLAPVARETSQEATPARRDALAAQRPVRQRIPESPTINGPRSSAMRAIERPQPPQSWATGRGGVTDGERQSPYGEDVLPARSRSAQAGASSGRQDDEATDGSARAPLRPDRGVRARNVAGEMTSMSDEMDRRYDDMRDPEQRATGGQRSLPYGGQQRPGGEPSDANMGVAPLTPPRLNQRYTFSTFIVGSGNQLAHAASQAVADAPGYAYNPLFLYGGVGLGKTHLLHAIGHTAIERGLTVLYVSSETFTNEIVNAILYRKTEEFRAKYRSVDVLLVDDIQFIAGKDSTEEEFFHTFNSLYETNRQIVICSDRPPKAIVSLEERLRSRFEWGLIADIQPPDLETRIAILRAKAELIGRNTPDEVILYVANRVQSNIRELEGSLNRVLAFAQLQGLPMSIETAKAAMASLSSDTRQRRVSIDDVISAVADFYRIQVDDLKGKQRDKHIVVPRHVAMYLMRQETEASLLEIGQALGGRDHSTVLHGCEKISREVNENTSLRKEVLAIRQQLLG